MKNTGKNIAFWKRYYLDILLGIAAIGLTALLFMGLRMNCYVNFLTALHFMFMLMPFYWMPGGGILLLAMTNSLYKGALPLSLSMGNTRKAAVCGMNLMYVAISATFTLLTLGVWAISGTQLWEIMEILPGIAGVYLTECAVCIAVGVIYSFLGKWGIVAVSFACGCLGAVLGMSLGMIEEQEVKIQEIFSMLGNPWICMAIGIAVFTAAAFLNSFVHRKVEVRM